MSGDRFPLTQHVIRMHKQSCHDARHADLWGCPDNGLMKRIPNLDTPGGECSALRPGRFTPKERHLNTH